MSKSFFDEYLKYNRELTRIKNQAIREQNAKIREENARIRENNQLMVEEWNQELERTRESIKKIVSNTTLLKFDSENYYKKMMVPLNIKDYTPLPRPDEKKIRKEIGCMRENKILEYIFKNRKETRISRGKKFEEKWTDEKKNYDKAEKKNYKEYTKYKNNEIKKNNDLNSKYHEKYKKFRNKNNAEFKEILSKFLNLFKNDKNIEYVKYISVSYDKGNTLLEIEFVNPENEINNIKRYNYLKTKNEYREVYYSSIEFEKIYETIVFNTMLSCGAKLQYYLDSKIDNLIINGYVEKINTSNGKIEKYYFCSVKLQNGDIPFDKLTLLDGKNYFDSKKARYYLPLISLKKVQVYSYDDKPLIDSIDSDINGFDFEKLSKTLLEKNDFENVEVTKASGDYGADIIAYKGGVKFAIQCKKYSSKVGVQAIQEVIAAKTMYKCHVGAVLTNNYFTPNAIRLAEANGILLWNKINLEEMIDKAQLNKHQMILENNMKELNSDIEYFDEQRYTDDELDKYNLEEWQKELVKKGLYEPWNFEDDDLEEYYYYYVDDE